MSFFSDLFSGNFSNLGHDLNPSNIFSDIGTDTVKTLENPLADVGIAAGIALPFLAPEIGGLLGGAGAADAATAGFDLGTIGPGVSAAGTSLGAATAAAPLDVSALTGAAADATLPTNAVLDVGTVPANVSSAFDASFGANPLTGGTVGNVAGAANAAGGGGVLDSITGAVAPVTNALKAVSPELGLAGLGYNLYSGYEQKQALNQLNQQEQTQATNAAALSAEETNAATPLLNSGATLMTYLQTGTLPQAFQAQVTQQVEAAKAAIIQGYATRGMSTNPQQNSQLAQDLANVDLQAQSLQANLESTLSTAGNQMVTTANSLLQSGLSATEFSSELPIKIAQLNSTLNTQMSSAVSNFAAALNGSGVKGGATITLPTNIVANSGTLQNLNG